MGNRNACSLFGVGGRDNSDKIWVDYLSEEENKTLKEMYTNMNISSNQYYYLIIIIINLFIP